MVFSLRWQEGKSGEGVAHRVEDLEGAWDWWRFEDLIWTDCRFHNSGYQHQPTNPCRAFETFPHQFHIRRDGIFRTIRKAWPVPVAFCRDPKNSNALNSKSIIPMKRVFVKFQHKKSYGISSMLKRTDSICKREQRSALDFSGFFKKNVWSPCFEVFLKIHWKCSFFTKVLSSIADHGSEKSFFSSRRKVI